MKHLPVKLYRLTVSEFIRCRYVKIGRYVIWLWPTVWGWWGKDGNVMWFLCITIIKQDK